MLNHAIRSVNAGRTKATAFPRCAGRCELIGERASLSVRRTLTFEGFVDAVVWQRRQQRLFSRIAAPQGEAPDVVMIAME